MAAGHVSNRSRKWVLCKTAKPKSKFWPVLALALLSGRIANFAGPAGIVIYVTKFAGLADNYVWSVAMRAAVFVGALYINSILVQATQNIAYKQVGVKEARMRW